MAKHFLNNVILPGWNLEMTAEAALGEDAAKVFNEASAGDVGHGGWLDFGFLQAPALLMIEQGRSQELRSFLLAEFDAFLGKDSANKTEAVGVEAGARPADEDVALFDLGWIEDVFFFRSPNGKA